MLYNDDTLNRIYDRTDGRCHVCGEKLSFVNYARRGRKGAWEVEHSTPRLKGGTSHLNNLYPACIRCNRVKGVFTSRTSRAWHGRKRAPLSTEKRKQAKRSKAYVGAIIGGFMGSFAGPLGIAAGAAIGATLSYAEDPDKV